MKLKKHLITILGLGILITGCNPQKNPDHSEKLQKQDGSVLPFPRLASESETGQTLAESKLAHWPDNTHLADDAPNVLIVFDRRCWFWGFRNIWRGSSHTYAHKTSKRRNYL